MRIEPAVTLVLCLGAASGAEPLTSESQAAWHLSSPLVTTDGLALWLDDGAGSWRLEISVAGDDVATEDDLRSRAGEGWTLASAAGPALVQPWGEPWRETSPNFTAAMTRLLGRWAGTTPVSPRAAAPWRATPVRAAAVGETLIIGEVPDTWNPGGLAGAPGGTLRRELAARGRGRGGPGLRLHLGPDAAGNLVLTSARWPGRLSLSPATTNRRGDVPGEAYLPIWSLAEIGLTPREP